ncbi:tetratricopeptide repeat protein [Streptomyces sp. NBC_00391]|uniref:tetratricopeptide repeat protein n=1 Tax=Streptomyces sp. NBC_00391 TaxID=2903647 RepID=UPI002E1B3FA5
MTGGYYDQHGQFVFGPQYNADNVHLNFVQGSSPNDPIDLYEWGVTAYRNGMRDRAREYLEQAISRGLRRPDLYYHYALLLVADGISETTMETKATAIRALREEVSLRGVLSDSEILRYGSQPGHHAALLLDFLREAAGHLQGLCQIADLQDMVSATPHDSLREISRFAPRHLQQRLTGLTPVASTEFTDLKRLVQGRNFRTRKMSGGWKKSGVDRLFSPLNDFISGRTRIIPLFQIPSVTFKDGTRTVGKGTADCKLRPTAGDRQDYIQYTTFGPRYDVKEVDDFEHEVCGLLFRLGIPGQRAGMDVWYSCPRNWDK